MENRPRNTASDNRSFWPTNSLSKIEAIAWCSAFTLVSFLIVTGNLLTIVLFAVNRRLRKRSFFLVINMACADLMLGAVSIPIFIYYFVAEISSRTAKMNSSVATFRSIFSVVFLQASITFAAMISGERLYATYWPFKHRALSRRTYGVVIFLGWTLVLLSSAILSVLRLFVSPISYYSFWVTYTLTLTFFMCACNIAVRKKFQIGQIASTQQNRALRNRRLTNTLLFISFLVLLSWIPLIILNTLYAFRISTNDSIYYLAVILNVFNCCANPIVYALRIPEFRQALVLLCYCGRTPEARNVNANVGRYNMAAVLTPVDLQMTSIANDLEVMETKL